jgi:ABC-type ATPase involved in cell division
MIELKEVTKEYSKGIAALNGINLRIEQGEFVFVVGDSGSGKSTLIRLLMKEIEPTSESESYETSPDSAVQKRNRRCIPGFQTSEGPQYL